MGFQTCPRINEGGPEDIGSHLSSEVGLYSIVAWNKTILARVRIDIPFDMARYLWYKDGGILDIDW